MRRLLRRFALAILAREIEERKAHARRLSTDAYRGTSERGRRGRVFWNGYERALEAFSESRDAL